METGDHFKNGASPKSHTNRGNLLRKAVFLAWFAVIASASVCMAQENQAITERLKQNYASVIYYDFNGGWYGVKLNGKEGVCDLSGKEVIPCKYERIVKHEGHYGVWINGKKGSCDLTGNEVVPCKYDDVVKHSSYGGYYGIRLNGKKGACDLAGNEIIPCKYDDVVLHEGYYGVKLDGKAGACDLSGKEVVPPNKYISIILSSGIFKGKLTENGSYEDISGYTQSQNSLASNTGRTTPATATQSGSSAKTSPAVTQEPPRVTIVNNTGYTVYYVNISPTDATDWQDDVMGKEVLLNDRSVTVKLADPLHIANRYDIMLTDEDGDTYTKWNVLIGQNSSIVFTLADIDIDDTDPQPATASSNSAGTTPASSTRSDSRTDNGSVTTTTQVTCMLCYGSGKQMCQCCAGTGQQYRNSLMGVYFIKCACCDGAGKITCSYCKGQGHTVVSSTYTPSTPQGSGSGYSGTSTMPVVPVSMPQGNSGFGSGTSGSNRIVCSRCSGTGNCSSCGGTGRGMSCGACGGKGQREIVNTYTTGTSWGACPTCSGKGYHDCTSCSVRGNGKCSQCRGSGYL